MLIYDATKFHEFLIFAISKIVDCLPRNFGPTRRDQSIAKKLASADRKTCSRLPTANGPGRRGEYTRERVQAPVRLGSRPRRHQTDLARRASDREDIAYTREVLAPYLDAEDMRTCVECLLGDAAGRTLGFTPRGLSHWAGLASRFMTRGNAARQTHKPRQPIASPAGAPPGCP